MCEIKKIAAICAVLICLVLLSTLFLNPGDNDETVDSAASPPADPTPAAQTTPPESAPETPAPATLFPEPPAELFAALDDAPTLTDGDSSLRKFPYPYRAMLAITSDCDSTTTEIFERMHRFLNTYEDTPYGTGLGLDISDSFFFYNGSDYDTADGLMSYCEGTDPDSLRDAGLIKKYYECGWIDSIHALGDFSNSGGTGFSRRLAERAWELMDEAGIAPTVWIDHGTYTNVQNFGAYNPNNASSYQAGDDPASPFYHTDITLSRSIRYAWYSRHSDEFGQDYPLSVRTLRDGSLVWSFQRYTSEFVGTEIDFNWRPHRLNEQITEERLDALIQNGQYSIVAQHLTVFQQDEQMGTDDIATLQMLAERHHKDKSILVARSSRLLDYALVWKHLNYQVIRQEGFTLIRILSISDPVGGERIPEMDDLRGITFYCDDASKTAVYIGDTLLYQSGFSLNPADETGSQSVTALWYEPDTTDYTVHEDGV